MGNVEMKDHMILDGLWDVYNQQHMGMCAEACAADFKISRAAQDEFALDSTNRAIRAQKEGLFKAELVPVPVGVVTVIGPVDAPVGTVVVTLVSLTTLKVADVPLNLTDVAPVKYCPVIVTAVPADPPPEGEKPEIVGAGAGGVTRWTHETEALSHSCWR